MAWGSRSCLRKKVAPWYRCPPPTDHALGGAATGDHARVGASKGALEGAKVALEWQIRTFLPWYGTVERFRDTVE